MNQYYQPCCPFFNSKYCVRPKTVALKKSKWLVKHFLSWFFFFNYSLLSDSRAEFEPVAKAGGL